MIKAFKSNKPKKHYRIKSVYIKYPRNTLYIIDEPAVF